MTVAAFGALASVEWARGFTPEVPAGILDSFNRRQLRELLPFPAMPVATAAVMILGVAMTKLLLLFSGRPWSYRTERSRRVAVSPTHADEILNRSLAELLRLGFTAADKRMESDGSWTLTSRRDGVLLRRTDLQRGQEVEFRYRDDSLTFLHRFPNRVDRWELGERDYQQWFLDGLLSGAPLEPPPRRISLGAFFVYSPALTLALAGSLVHFVPGWIGAGWDNVAVAGSLLVFLVSMPFGLAVLLMDRRTTIGAVLALPGLVLAALGSTLVLARPYDWERNDWKTSDDPRVVVAAGASAYRMSDSPGWTIRWMTDRELAAWDAGVAIEARIVAMGAGAAPLLVELDSGHRPADDWARRMIGRIGEPAFPAIAEALQSSDPNARQSAIWTAASVPPSPGLVMLITGLLRDADPDVRVSAAEYFSSRHDLSNLFSPPPGGPRSGAIATSLLELLGDPDKDVRDAAVRALGHQQCAEAVPRLSARLAGGDADHQLVYALVQIGDPLAIPALLERLAQSGSSSVEHSLGSFGAPVIDPLLDRLDSTLGPVAHRILRSLPESLDLGPSTCARLVGLSNDPNSERRVTALMLLANSPCPEATGTALAALDDAAASIRAAVAWPLFRRGLAGPEDLARLLDEEEAIVEPLLHRLREPEVSIAAKVAAIAIDPDRPAALRLLALRTLCRLGPARAAEVADAVQRDSSPELKRQAIRPNSGAPSPLSTRTLLMLVEDTDEETRQIAAVALGERNDPAAAATLLKALLQDSSPRVRSAAATALGRLRFSGAVPALCAAVAAERYRVNGSLWTDDDVCRAALTALGQIGDAGARETLHKTFRRARHEDDLPTAYAAVIALAMTGDTDALPDLRRIRLRPISVACGSRGCISPEGIFATVALGRLGESGADELLSMIASRSRTYPEAAEALGSTRSPRAFTVLEGLLKDPAPLWRAMAAQGLGRLEDPRAIEALLPIVEDADIEVTLAGAWALQELTGTDFGIREHEIYSLTADRDLQQKVRSTVHAWASSRK